MTGRGIFTAVCCLLVAGCSTASSLVSTGSVSGAGAGAGANANTSAAIGVTPVATNDPLDRALHVGAVSARAIRCGFHFDAAQLKANYMASETASGLSVSDMANVDKMYSTGFNGVSKGIGDAKSYCTNAKVARTKIALTRYLAGDYSAPKKKVVAKTDDGGAFGFLFNGDDELEKGPKFGSGDWWENQRDKSGS